MFEEIKTGQDLLDYIKNATANGPEFVKGTKTYDFKEAPAKEAWQFLRAKVTGAMNGSK